MDRGVVLAADETELSRLDRVIADFCVAVVAEPLCYFSEADLQGMLYARMIKEFPLQVETSCSRGPDSKGCYRTGMVHREYGAGGARRIDISVLAEADLREVDGPDLRVRKKYMRPRFAVELGTEKTVDTVTHIAGDLKKLSTATERGYLIHFFRDVTKADTGTQTRVRTEERIKAIFREPVGTADPHGNVRRLCFLLRIARSRRKIWGKCELFNPATRTWRKVNLERVREAVLESLR
jgi:hypothetical protein